MDPIRARLVELVPEIMELVAVSSPVRANSENIYKVRPITLADVLLAIQEHGKRTNGDWVTIDKNGRLCTEDANGEGLLGVWWNLSQDFDNQDQPTKEFIGRLLGVTN